MREHILFLGQSDRKGASETNKGAKDQPELIVSCRISSTTTEKIAPVFPVRVLPLEEPSPKPTGSNPNSLTKIAERNHQVLNPKGISTVGYLVAKPNQQKRYFVENSRLREYLHKVCLKQNYAGNDRKHFFLHNVLQDLSKHIKDSKQFDSNNPVIILCNAELSRAVDRLGFHLKEMRDLVTTQCCTGNTYEDVNKTYADFLLTERLKVKHEERLQEAALTLLSLKEQGEQLDPAIATHGTGGDSPKTSRSMIEYDQSPDFFPTWNRAHRISRSEQKQAKALRAKLFPKILKAKKDQSKNIVQDTIIQKEKDVTFFRIRPRLWKCFKEIPSLDQETTIYTLNQAAKLLSTYILLPENKKRFFDDRNIKVLHCEGTDLGRAFRVNAFHRTQAYDLLQSQIVPLIETPEDDGRNSTDVEQITI